METSSVGKKYVKVLKIANKLSQKKLNCLHFAVFICSYALLTKTCKKLVKQMSSHFFGDMNKNIASHKDIMLKTLLVAVPKRILAYSISVYKEMLIRSVQGQQKS